MVRSGHTSRRLGYCSKDNLAERTLTLRTCCFRKAIQFVALFEKVTLTPLKRRIDPFGF